MTTAVLEAVEQELALVGPADLRTWAQEALRAAEDLLQHPRSRWARPEGAWEALVVALAVAARRVEGAEHCSGPAALRAVGEAVDELLRRRAA